ncbi:MAG: ABC transporter permease [Roseburia sp.]|nr:ABC transporter permease [Roseburia sp.]
MERLKIYFQLECKKFFRSLPGILGGALLIGLIAGGLIFVCEKTLAKDQEAKTMHIGVAAQENEPYVDWMISTIENMDSLSFTCRFQKLPEQTANEKLRSGTLDAVFVIPPDYIASLVSGRKNPLKIRFGNRDSAISGFLIRQIGEAASELMIHTQAGIYAMKDFYRKTGLPDAAKDEMDLNLKYLDTIMGREKLLTVEEVSQDQGLSGSAYYVVSGFVLILLFWGLACSGILRPEPLSVQEKLYQSGLGTVSQTLLRYFAFTLSFLAMYLFFAGLFCIGTAVFDIHIPGLYPENTLQWLLCLLQLLPAVFPACALIFFVYEIITNKIASTLFFFLLIFLLGYLSGCFYPLSYLPQSIQTAASVLPLRAMFLYAGRCLTGTWSLTALSGILIHTLFFLGVSAALKRFSIKFRQGGFR